jgi:hypothetical protein
MARTGVAQIQTSSALDSLFYSFWVGGGGGKQGFSFDMTERCVQRAVSPHLETWLQGFAAQYRDIQGPSPAASEEGADTCVDIGGSSSATRESLDGPRQPLLTMFGSTMRALPLMYQ